MIVYRMETAEGFGPFHPPFDPASFAEAVPWVNCEVIAAKDHGAEYYEDPVTGEHMPTTEALIPDETHPHHLADIADAAVRRGDLVTALQLYATGDLPGDDWLVGAKDEAQLLHWFPPVSLPYFEGKGMLVRRYDVPQDAIAPGRFQLAFRKSAARLIDEVKPTALARQPEAA